MTYRDTELRTAIEGCLAGGPLRIDEVIARSQAAGVLSDDDDEAWEQVTNHLDTTDSYWRLDHESLNEQVVLARTFLDTGMTLTHRVTEVELADGAVAEDPDLELLTTSVGEGFSAEVALADGGVLATEAGQPNATRIVGPEGWLDDVAAGDLLAFTRTDEMVTITIVDEPGDDSAELEALRASAADWIPEGAGMDTHPLVMDALARDPQLFRTACRPIGELLEALGLEKRDAEWGRADTTWQTRRERWSDSGGVRQREWGFDQCCERAFVLARAALGRTDDERDLRAVSDALAHGDVTPALVSAHSPAEGPDLLGELDELGDALASSLSGRSGAAGLGLKGFVALTRGAAAEAHDLLERAVGRDGDLASAREALAALELDRGEIGRAATLVQHEMVAPSMRQLVIAERDRRAGLRPKVGRNDPCPCGSGRKFKQCCARGGSLRLADRLPLVTQRLALYAASPVHASKRFSLAITAAVGDDFAVQVREMVNDPFLSDVLIHEGGVGDQYLEERRQLLQADEADLLDRMLSARRRLWEVEEVDEGSSLSLRDTGTGDRATVIERSGSIGRSAGDFLLARAAEVDGETLLFGLSLVVPLSQRNRVMRMLDDPLGGHVMDDELIQWYGHLLSPPTVNNREGEALVLRRTELRVITPDASAEVETILDSLYDRQDGDLVWNEYTDIDGERVIRATIELDEDEIVVTSNSDERQDRVIAALEAQLSVFVLLDTVADPDDLADTDGGEGFDDEPPSPEALEAMQTYLLDYERRWIDREIPALGGLTPRQAYDDPTRREDLDSLLREFGEPEPDGPPMMSASRIRAMLEETTPGA